MGCLESNPQESNNYNNNNYNNRNNVMSTQDYIDTDKFNEGSFPHFKYNFFEKYIKNINKVYEERILEGNNNIDKIHKIYIIINYKENKTTSIEIEKENLNDVLLKKHLKKRIYNGCSLDNINLLLEKYNSIFKIDSTEWYQSKETTDIYIKAEKDTKNIIKYFQMFYEKDTQTLKVNKIVKYNIADASSKEEFQVTDNDPNMVVQKYNEFKLLYHDKEPEILCKNNDNLFEGINNSYHGNRGNNDNNGNNHSYYSNGNNDNNNNNNNNESQNQGLISSGIMRNGNNRQIGSVDRDGVVRDSCNRQIGKFEDDGVVRNSCNRQIGKIEDDGVVRNSCNRQIGKIDDDGVVRDSCNRQIGKIDDDGVVRDSCNREIGRAEGISKEQAAFMYFFK